MRIRNTKPEFFRSKRVSERIPDWGHRYLLKALESYVDDNGVGKDDLALIAADCFSQDIALDPSGTFQRLTEGLSVLFEAGFIHRYTANGDECLYISWWESTQYVQKPKAGRLPRPDGTFDYGTSEIGEPNRNFPEASGSVQPVSGNQGIRESGYIPASDDAGQDNDEESFEAWWPHYPKKVDKGQARKAFKAALKKVDLDTLTEAADTYAAWIEREGKQQFTKYPATWLNAEAWANGHSQPEPDQPRHPDAPDNRTVFELSDEEYAERERIHRERIQAKREAAAAGGG